MSNITTPSNITAPSNVTSPSTTIPSASTDKESAAMLYVSITVMVFSAVVMCCTWFVARNKTVQTLCERFCRRTSSSYGTLSREEEQEMIQTSHGAKSDGSDKDDDEIEIPLSDVHLDDTRDAAV